MDQKETQISIKENHGICLTLSNDLIQADINKDLNDPDDEVGMLVLPFLKGMLVLNTEILNECNCTKYNIFHWKFGSVPTYQQLPEVRIFHLSSPLTIDLILNSIHY